jgi:diaminopimelate decarboxylase
MGSGLILFPSKKYNRLHAGYEPEKIFYNPNGVSLEEIEEVMHGSSNKH